MQTWLYEIARRPLLSTSGNLNVRIQRVGPKDGGSALIALDLILLKGGHIAAVRVGQAGKHDCDILTPCALHLLRDPHAQAAWSDGQDGQATWIYASRV